MKEIDAPINYDKKSFTYYYTDDFDLEVRVSIKALKKNEIITIYGGYSSLALRA
ncbi:hypothetical protein [Ochrovirga pacifica]|uniref:hypothetical protein n=1 Tax=Ochrovirga pacifica TaxID=1042376 RepID=UPI0002E12AE0|nr:hypothetical protein [Ochrovirga pacifica]